MINGELSINMKNNNYDIFVRRDKDFTILWKKYDVNVICLKIKPLTLQNLQLRLDHLFDNWLDTITSSFLIELQLKSIEIEEF